MASSAYIVQHKHSHTFKWNRKQVAQTILPYLPCLHKLRKRELWKASFDMRNVEVGVTSHIKKYPLLVTDLYIILCAPAQFHIGVQTYSPIAGLSQFSIYCHFWVALRIKNSLLLLLSFLYFCSIFQSACMFRNVENMQVKNVKLLSRHVSAIYLLGMYYLIYR